MGRTSVTVFTGGLEIRPWQRNLLSGLVTLPSDGIVYGDEHDASVTGGGN